MKVAVDFSPRMPVLPASEQAFVRALALCIRQPLPDVIGVCKPLLFATEMNRNGADASQPTGSL